MGDDTVTTSKPETSNNERSVDRRTFLKGTAAAAAGVAAGSSAIGGFPTVWAQEDITLNHSGMSYSTIIQIAEKATEDLPITVEMSVTDHAGMLNRLTTQSDAIDVADIELWMRVITVPRGVYQAIDPSKITHWDKVTPIYRDGHFADAEVSRQGVSPYEVMYFTDAGAETIADSTTDYATMIPGVFNADTLGIQPEAIGRPVNNWHELFNDEFNGRAAGMDIPPIMIMDAAMCIESAGDYQYADKGNMTKDEISMTVDRLIDLKKKGHWRSLWGTFDQSVQLMVSGEVVIQSMWSPAVTAVRAQGVPCVYQPLEEGYRGWGNGLSLMSHLEGKKLDAAYDYLNWYYSGWMGAFIAKQGYYLGVAETAKDFMQPYEWDYWYEGKPAEGDINDPYGTNMEKPGHVRDGGSFVSRFSKIACWNTLMDNHQFLLKKWTELQTA